LGRIGSSDADVDISAAQKNSNRWIFDVVHDTAAEKSFVFTLTDARSGKPKPANGALLSFTFSPLDAAAAGARLHVSESELPELEISADPAAGVIYYRVTVDVVHSLVR
jgi:hypothetical protein